MSGVMKTITAEVVDTGQKRDKRGRRIVRVEERVALLAAYAKRCLQYSPRYGQSLSSWPP